jgi:hypothetical protein
MVNRTSLYSRSQPGEGGRGCLVAGEGVPPPKLLGIHAVAALDLAVLIGTPRLDVPKVDAAPLDGEEKGEGELRAVVGLQLPAQYFSCSEPRRD